MIVGSTGRSRLRDALRSRQRESRVPRFFFDIQDGAHIVDTEGTELPGVQAARVEAAKMAGTLLSEHASEFWSGDEWIISVRDETDVVLFNLIFLAVNSPASRPASARVSPPGPEEQ